MARWVAAIDSTWPFHVYTDLPTEAARRLLDGWAIVRGNWDVDAHVPPIARGRPRHPNDLAAPGRWPTAVVALGLTIEEEAALLARIEAAPTPLDHADRRP